MTADLAISGNSTDTFGGKTCSVTLANPIQYVAWWMLTFPVDTVYIKNVQMYYRSTGEYFFHINTFSRYIAGGGGGGGKQDFKLGGTLKKIAPSGGGGGRGSKIVGVFRGKKITILRKKILFFSILRAPPPPPPPPPPWNRPCIVLPYTFKQYT